MGAKKKTLITCGENGRGDPIHYFASSLGAWRTDVDLLLLLKRMERDGLPFNVYRVDLPKDAAYEIEYYRPVVDSDKLVWVGFFEWKE